jgi:D-alanyl-D-alanine carboxypeptidase (penicillin-binding protein 5/6)
VVVVGSPPNLPWPAQGEAALYVEGIGSLGAAGGNTPVPIASMAKVMTAYLVLLHHPLGTNQAGFTLTVTPGDVTTTTADQGLDESIIPLVAGEKLSERQALEALLLPSADNLAIDLAAADAGSVSAFVIDMNNTARALDMTHTEYTDPSGYTPTTVSTPEDQVLLARVALKVPALAQIVALPEVTLPVAGTVSNYNALVGHNGVIGIKTGSTSQAGGCLLFAAKEDLGGQSVTVLGAVLGQDIGSPDSDLISAALNASSILLSATALALQPKTVITAGTPVIEAIGPDGSHVAAVTTRSIRLPVVRGIPVPLTFTAVAHPTAKESALAGTVTVDIGGTGGNGGAGGTGGNGGSGDSTASSPVVFPHSLPGPGLWWRFTHVF